MKGRIDKHGVLYIKRGSVEVRQSCCEREGKPCSHWCPQFGEPEETNYKSAISIEICQKRVLVFEELIDERVEAKKPIVNSEYPNYKFRKKPIVVEAFQMTKERGQINADWPKWLHKAWCEDDSEPGSLSIIKNVPERLFQCQTLEGPLTVNWGDWIIQGIKGEIYPCKPDIFEATYEPVTE